MAYLSFNQKKSATDLADAFFQSSEVVGLTWLI